MSFLREERNRNYFTFFLLVALLCLISIISVNIYTFDELRYLYGQSSIKLLFLNIVCAMLPIVILLLFICILFEKREKEYEEAIEIISEFEKGDFSRHLPKNKEGNFYSLMSQIDCLAVTLKSRAQSESEVRELINDRIADIAHQLKTPLAALLMYNEIMEQETEQPEVIGDFNTKSKKALLRMQNLITSLLVMTRLDAGTIVFEKERYYVKELVTESIQELTIRAQKEQKELVVKGDVESCVYCDKKWTMEAISNLVKNALDHIEAGGRIDITWEENQHMTRVSVQDNGCGICDEDRYFIFKKFYRSKNNKNPGVGLGLPLTKSIIEGQGGSIHMESYLGEGTTFTICLFHKDSY